MKKTVKQYVVMVVFLILSILLFLETQLMIDLLIKGISMVLCTSIILVLSKDLLNKIITLIKRK